MKEKILVINTQWPEEACPVQAATLVNYQLISELAKREGLRIGYLKVSLSGESEKMNDIQKDAQNNLESIGVTYLAPLKLPKFRDRRTKIMRLLRPKLSDYYPITQHRSIAYNAAKKFNPTAIMTQWCEQTTHLYAEYPAKKFTYYGNADPIIHKTWTEYINISQEQVVRKILRNLKMKQLERFHLQEMNKWDYIGVIGLNFAEYYKDKIGKKAFYLNNIWINRYGDSWKKRRSLCSEKRKFRIVGNIGSLAASANTMGLEILARDVVPELRKLLPEDSFEIDIYGRHKPLPHVDKLLRQPEINIRGFVVDIDKEMMESDVFLCVNNMSSYKTAHTRFLHAWSLGCCVVAASDAVFSMPEMKHEQNALLGRNPFEIAQMILRAKKNPELRHRIGLAGYETMEKEFRVDHVVDVILEKLESIRV